MDDLEKHESAFSELLGQVPCDDQPRAEHRDALRQRALAAFDTANRRHVAPVAWKRILNHGREQMRRPLPRFVLAASICLAVAAWWLLLPGQQSTAHAFDEFAKAILEARSATFETTVKMEGMPEQKMKSFYLAPGKMRTESNIQGAEAVGIVDTKSGKMMILSPTQKTAMVMNMKNAPKDPKTPQAGDLFEQMRDLLSRSQDRKEGEFKPIAEKEIDGRRALGFRQESPLQTTTLWGDPATGLPVLIEQSMHGVANFDSTMSHFVLNDDLKPDLFDMTPPEGYKVQTLTVDASAPTEETLIETLDVSADENEDRFLDNLDVGTLMLGSAFKGGQPNPKASGEKEINRAASLARGIIFAMMLPESADAHYAGKGVKRDQPDRPIFWYKPEGGEKYRVIYADLSVKEADRAPEIAGAVRMVDAIKKTVPINQQLEAMQRKNTERKEAVWKAVANLKVIAMAMQSDKEAHDRFPPAAITDTDGKPLLSWRVKLLPYLNEQELYEQFHLDEPWDSEHNLPLVKKMPACYASSTAAELEGMTVFLVPTGKDTIFFDNQGTSPEQIAAPLDETILIVMADDEHAVPWTKPEDLHVDRKHPAAGLAKDQDFFTVAWADGSSGRLSAEGPALWGWFTRASGGRAGMRSTVSPTPLPQPMP
jgi:outer membrane lipoprotein-sorting protein